MIKSTGRISGKLALILIGAVLIFATLSSSSKVHAAALTKLWLVETNMDASGTSQLYVAFIAGTTGSAGTLSIALGSGVSAVGSTNTNLGTTTAGCVSMFQFLTTPPVIYTGSPTATGSGTTISVTGGGSLTSGTAYCLGFTGTSAVTNSSTAGVYSYTISDTSDTGTEYYPVLTSGTNNTISVTATVPQSFTLSLGGNSDGLGTLTASNPSTTTGITATIGTNAANGFGLWAYDTNGGLNSPSTTHNIQSTSPGSGSLQTLSNGTEGYVTNVSYITDTAGTAPTTTTPFTSGTAYTGDGLNTVPAQIAKGTGPVSGAQIKIKESAEMSNITPEATDYADSITIVGAGSF